MMRHLSRIQMLDIAMGATAIVLMALLFTEGRGLC